MIVEVKFAIVDLYSCNGGIGKTYDKKPITLGPNARYDGQ